MLNFELGTIEPTDFGLNKHLAFRNRSGEVNMVDGSGRDLTAKLVEHFIVSYIPIESKDRADVHWEGIDKIAGCEFSQLHSILYIVHVTSNDFIPSYTGGPL